MRTNKPDGDKVRHLPTRSAASGSPAATAPRGSRYAAKARRRSSGFSTPVKAGIVVVLAILALGVIFTVSTRSGEAGKYPYQVGKPGPGQPAPPFQLPFTGGGTYNFAAQRGNMVLLYFQEGVGCQPCWDQLKDIQLARNQFQSVGVDEIVTITTSPMDALKQKVADEGIALPVLYDADATVSKEYQANLYGMMGTSMDGHTFVLVGKDGVIIWRADYGGAPKYTMDVPVPNLLADIRAGLAGTAR